jgi:hypothetical protein
MALIDGLISYYNLDEASGTRFDSHGSNHLTDNNTVGSTEDGAHFDRDNEEFLSITDAAQSGLDLSGDFMISAWVIFDELPSDAGSSFTLVSKFASSGNQQALRILFLDSGAMQVYVSGDGTSSNRDFWTSTSTSLFTINTIYSIIVTYEVSAREFQVYVNDNNNEFVVEAQGVTTNQGSVSSIFNSSAPFMVGAVDGSLYHDGVVAKLGIWPRLPATGELTQLYNNGVPLPYSSIAPTIATPRRTLLGAGA